jgi:hypothetical protein
MFSINPFKIAQLCYYMAGQQILFLNRRMKYPKMKYPSGNKIVTTG